MEENMDMYAVGIYCPRDIELVGWFLCPKQWGGTEEVLKHIKQSFHQVSENHEIQITDGVYEAKIGYKYCVGIDEFEAKLISLGHDPENDIPFILDGIKSHLSKVTNYHNEKVQDLDGEVDDIIEKAMNDNPEKSPGGKSDFDHLMESISEAEGWMMICFKNGDHLICPENSVIYTDSNLPPYSHLYPPNINHFVHLAEVNFVRRLDSPYQVTEEFSVGIKQFKKNTIPERTSLDQVSKPRPGDPKIDDKKEAPEAVMEIKADSVLGIFGGIVSNEF